MKPIYLLIAAATLALVSCARGGQEGGAALKYVQDIISGEDTVGHATVCGYGQASRNGAVYVTGPYAAGVRVVKGLLRFESFDNVTGQPVPDGLPDFAGEKICTIYDMEPAADEEQMRTSAVRGLVQAMDSVCYVSPYDNRGLGTKPVAKVILLASPYAAANGLADIDTLLAVSGAKIPVVCPLRSALEPFFKGRRGGATVAVLTTKEYASGDAYRGYVNYLTAKQGLDSSLCIVSADSSATPFLSLLEHYAAHGFKTPVDILLVDNPDLDIRAIYENIMRIRSVMNQESLLYGNMISKDFRVVDLSRKGAEECLKALRSGNLFTHRVAWPESMEYMYAEGKILQYNTKYLVK